MNTFQLFYIDLVLVLVMEKQRHLKRSDLYFNLLPTRQRNLGERQKLTFSARARRKINKKGAKTKKEEHECREK